MAGAQKKIKVPKLIGDCADRLFTVRAERLEAQRGLEPFREEEKILTQHIIDTLPKSNTSGVAGKKARVSVTTKTVPTVTDWDAFYAHVLKTKDFSLMGRGINAEAIQERWDAKKKIPGIGPFKVVSLSLNKI